MAGRYSVNKWRASALVSPVGLKSSMEDTPDMDSESVQDAESRQEMVKMTVTLPRSVAAFLRWKAEVEGMKRDELLRKIIVHYAKKLREEDFRTPPID